MSAELPFLAAFARLWPGLRVIDSHVHVGVWGRRTVAGRSIEPFRHHEHASLVDVLRHLRRHRIDLAVVVPTYSPDPRTAFAENRLLPESAKKAGGRLIPGCWVDPSPAVAGLLRETLDLAREHGIRVLKTSCDGWAGKSSADPASWGRALTRNMERILEYVRAAGAVFQVHTGHDRSHVRLVEKLVRFAGAGVAFHLVHLGGCVSGQFYLLPRLREWADEGLDVVTDTSMASGFAVRWSLRLARTNPAVANRVLFASDAPWGTFESEISKVLATVGSGTTIVRKVLFDNAARVYMTRSSG